MPYNYLLDNGTLVLDSPLLLCYTVHMRKYIKMTNDHIPYDYIEVTITDGLLEEIADLCHQQWGGWMEYLFAKSTRNDDGTVVIPKDLVARWTRQMNTLYDDLSESEKDSDRRQAQKFINLLKAL